jgi:hypothetical protein
MLSSLRALRLCLAVLLLPAAQAASAQGIQRCEDGTGRATYTNGPCPSGTQATRPVNTAPAVPDAERKAAEARTRQDSQAVKAIERERAAEEARTKAQADKARKAEAGDAARCDKARRDLERARSTRSELSSRAATVEQMQRADREVGRREEDLSRACGKP